MRRHNIEGSSQELDITALSGKEKFEKILALFGTESAKNNFLDLCRQYFELRVRDDARAGAENYRTIKQQYSPARRSGVHNSIMDALKKLSLIPKMADATRKILNEMADREVTASYIKEYLRSAQSSGYEQDDDEDDAFGQPKRGNQSEAAYYRSLGKGG